MTLRFKLIFNYLLIIAALLFIFCFCIYFQSKFERKKEFQVQLKQEVADAATIFFKENEISPELLQILDRNNLTKLYDEEIIIFDANLGILYESGKDKLDFNKIKLYETQQNGELFWIENQREFYGKIILNQGKQYLIVSSGIDKYGFMKLKNIAYILILGGFTMVLLSSLAGWFFVKKMLYPIKRMISKIDEIKGSNLTLRLNEGNRNDELEQLAIRFNQMLDRLQATFLAQRAFVSNASHELRTPLTSITGQIQVSLLADDSIDDIKLMIRSVLEDVQMLNKLSNNLLDLTSIDIENYKPNFTLINILDKISRVRMEILQKRTHGEVNIVFKEHGDSIPEMQGTPELLYTAFYNLIENGLKYSTDNTIEISLEVLKTGVSMLFQNKSNVLDSSDIQFLFDPFVRGGNSKNIRGHGVGLSLTKKIIELHKGTIEVRSTHKDGFVVLIFLPKN
ncbi:MAG: ATP-binding protein [Leadbetterella sp.]